MPRTSRQTLRVRRNSRTSRGLRESLNGHPLCRETLVSQTDAVNLIGLDVDGREDKLSAIDICGPSLLSFSSFKFPGAPYRIFLLFLPCTGFLAIFTLFSSNNDTLPDFPSVSSQAFLPFLPCCHRTKTTDIATKGRDAIYRRNIKGILLN